MTKRIKQIIDQAPWSVFINLLLVYACYMICRVVFVWENMDIFRGQLTAELWLRMLQGATRFDASAIIYTNLPYLLLVLLPLHYKECPLMRRVTKWVFIVANTLAITVNLMDTVYFAYTQRRTTISIFQEFGGNTNIGDIVLTEFVNHWYLVLLAAALVALLWVCYRPTIVNVVTPSQSMHDPTADIRGGDAPTSQSTPAGISYTLKGYYIRYGVMLVVLGPILVMGMRGNTFFHINRPISASEANEYIDQPAQAGIVLNTPFTLIRSSSRTHIVIPDFYATEAEAEAIFSPVHRLESRGEDAPHSQSTPDSIVTRRKNVVIILMESMSEEFMQSIERPEAGDRAEPLVPFVDSLYRQSLRFEQTFANGWLSIDGIPVIQASLPKMYNPYIVSPYSLNETPGLAKELGKLGYHSAYFHGAEDASLGLKASARSTGIVDYYGMSEYIADPRTGGKADYDGTWGIWDEEFLQYFCTKLGEMPQPFYATVFTLNAHHPFSMPEKYRDVYTDKDPDYPVKKCITYTDNAVRLFFESARKQPWYANTLFVITADHCYRKVTRESYRNYAGYFRIPIMFYDPSGELPAEVRPGIAQQIDIMPTILGYLGYTEPYTAFGKDLLNTPAEDTWAFSFQDFPQYIKGDYLIQMRDFELAGVYRYRSDFRLEHNLLESGDYDQAYVEGMLAELKAILQVTETRMKTNTLTQISID